jgi:hypothetical protein
MKGEIFHFLIKFITNPLGQREKGLNQELKSSRSP